MDNLTDEEREYLEFENYINTAAESEMLAALSENDEVFA